MAEFVSVLSSGVMEHLIMGQRVIALCSVASIVRVIILVGVDSR